MTDPMPAVFDALNWPVALRPVDHRLTRIISGNPITGSISGECSCGEWSMESVGTDESSRAAVNYAFRMHVKREASK
jgi:hypothetical protein